jgi:hypothetical protein
LRMQQVMSAVHMRSASAPIIYRGTL